jgi:hypothetical protein
MNFVRRSHIRRGLERYADTYREILESPQLPEPSRIAAAAAAIGSLSRAELEARGRQQLQRLQDRYGDENDFPDEWYMQAMASNGYLEQLTRPQLEAMLFLDYMQRALGRRPEQAARLAMEKAGPGEASP